MNARKKVHRQRALLVAALAVAGCSEPLPDAERRAVAARQAIVAQRPYKRDPDCIVTLPGWRREDQALYGGCYLYPWQAFVKSTDMPALFARYGLPGEPPLLNPTGYADNNTLEYRLTWLGAPDLPARIRRWRAPSQVDCSRRLGDACYTEDVDPVLFEAADYMAAAQRGEPHLTFYWDADHEALLGQYEPWDLYTYAAFYVGDVQVELRAYHGTQRYFPVLIDLARREMRNWVRTDVDTGSTPGNRP